ncbi:kinase-like protein [Cutaneotrichosporon oleaginosum]|uniref:Mitogen-activated protein kinase n=1 Tax=Cutaneotrichosporon oleaginosum TaxID=879819 RepID=A0A0J1B043_9TREE|nr:kinase-like protein [Cutaneotrichosporon oleaginosum]KLT40954.1 kinase-like protein [Cutaneotrichosporon oleaginosum]TXT06224.1 hypothetical protein COLE_05555 [Cutaneotrichosporon oleaginosum]
MAPPSRPRSPPVTQSHQRTGSNASQVLPSTTTPQTGASRLAAAAAAGSKRREGRELKYGEDEHPLSEQNLSARGYHSLHAMKHVFHVPNRWKLLRALGQGAYGLVVSVQDTLSGEPVAIKCITRVFDKPILARRALREITLLRHFGEHENLTGLIDLDNVWDGYNEIYLYMEPMEADLHQIVRSGQTLSNHHIQFFLYQLLRGMKYIHTANVIHRDLKPGNLLVNSDCELKICDFGLARGFKPVGEQVDELRLTEYVATRWYRAPEIMLSNRRYTTAIDVWSIGCILAELLGGKPVFKGKDYVDQLNLILGVLGTPDDDTLKRMSSEKARAYLKTLPYSPRVALEDVFPDAEHDAVDLLSKLLVFDPDERIDVTTALQHPYVGTYHDPADEPSCPAVFDKWEEVEGLQTVDELREAITREIAEYRAEVRGLAELADGFDDEYEYDEDELEADGELYEDEVEELVQEPEIDESVEAVAVPQTRFADSQREDLGIQPALSPNASPRVRRVTLPNQRRVSRRDESPATPVTNVSEESFGHTPGAGARPTHSRRSSTQSTQSVTHRRSMSFLFGGVGGMTSLSMSSTKGAAGGNAVDDTAVSSAEYTANSMRRSRAPSSTVDALRPLIRQLSASNLADMRINTDDQPLHSDKSPRPGMMISRRSSRGSRSDRSRRPSSVCLATETASWRQEAREEHEHATEDADETATEQPPPTEDTAVGTPSIN